MLEFKFDPSEPLQTFSDCTDLLYLLTDLFAFVNARDLQFSERGMSGMHSLLMALTKAQGEAEGAMAELMRSAA